MAPTASARLAANPTRRGLGKIGGIAVAVVTMAVVRAGFAAAGSETWTEHRAVDDLYMSAPHDFESGPSSDKMRQSSMHARRAYVEAVAADIPDGSEYDLDAGMEGVVGLVTGRAGNAIANQTTAKEKILGWPGERCRFDLTREGTTVSVEVRIFCTPAKAYGVIVGGENADVQRIVSSLRLKPR